MVNINCTNSDTCYWRFRAETADKALHEAMEIIVKALVAKMPTDCPECGAPIENGKCTSPARHG